MRRKGIALVVTLLLLSAHGNQSVEVDIAVDEEAPIRVSTIEFTPSPTLIAVTDCVYLEETIASVEDRWTPEESWAMALTLAGECYDDKEHDKRLVCEVILNRVSAGRFGDSIYAVLTAKHQFAGYWKQSRPVSANDIEVVEQALDDWFNNDCKALSDYLFFRAGNNRENKFRATFDD